MIIVQALFCSLWCSMFRVKDGSDKISKGLSIALMAIVPTIAHQDIYKIFDDILYNHIFIYVCLLCLMLVYLTPGWGKYFSCIDRKDNRNARAIPIIDSIYNYLFPKIGAYKVGILCMGLRHFVLSLPLFFFLKSPFLSLPLLGVGFIYYFWGIYFRKMHGLLFNGNYAINRSEYFIGALVGFLIVVTKLFTW